ncbi:MAG: peptidase [Burkholderiales bacterium 68-12]|nr:MAG: peptidase [Burkholderiales bacterium 68-12]
MILCTLPFLRRPATLALAGALLAAAPALQADERDHELARQALEQGQILPLRSVLEKVERDYQGQVLKIEFERDDGRFVYKIRLLQGDGRMAKLKVDAVDGRVLGIQRREHERDAGKDRDAHPRR